MVRTLILAASFVAAWVDANAQSQTDPHTFRTANWPCEQQKAIWLAPEAFWSGPEIDESVNWRETEGIPALADELISSKTPLPDAERQIAHFAKKNDSDRRQRLTLLFVGVFSETNRVHAEIVQGIERAYRNRQSKIDELARTREEVAALSAKTERTDLEIQRLEKLQTQTAWLIRVWAQPEKSMRDICEVPLMMEQRLYDLAKIIEDQFPSAS